MAVGGAPVATRYTFEFVRRSLAPSATGILEIGCGAGELAAMLASAGLNVDALDYDEACVEEARARGLNAEWCSWPAQVDRRYDAVLFTRSLHHIHDLVGAITAAVRALRPNGRIIVEDFRAEGGSDGSQRWFKEMVRSLREEGALREDTDLATLLAKTVSADHEHELHSSSAIAAALETVGVLQAEDSAYYFRYLESELRSQERAEGVLELELSSIASGALNALGKRFVVTLQE